MQTLEPRILYSAAPLADAPPPPADPAPVDVRQVQRSSETAANGAQGKPGTRIATGIGLELSFWR